MSDQPKLPRPSRIYWLTRDSVDGVLSHMVDVWDARPTLHRRADGREGVFWLDPNDGVGLRYGTFPIDALAGWRHALPETERECIRVEMGLKE